MKRDRSTTPRYEEIAVEVARKIVDREFQEGDRILGRSTLAGTYKVSPETVRRAVAILHDRGIVKSVPGSGIRIVSRQNAADFLETLRTRSALAELQEELADLLAERHQLDGRIEDLIHRMAQLAGRAVATARRVEEVTITETSWLVGQTLGSARLRNQTGATVIALVRGSEEYFSPGPDFALQAGDLLMVVGPDAARERLQRLVEEGTPPLAAQDVEESPDQWT